VIDRIGSEPLSDSANAPAFRTVFLNRVHELLCLGYQRLDPKTHVSDDETAITGDLVEAMDAVIDDSQSRDWVRLFHVKDDPPINIAGRRGKHRRRIDIEVVSGESRPRSHFSFEAKRLRTNTSLGEYLGVDGLGCFLAGHYASNEDDAGMLGYVQSRSAKDWADDLQTRLRKSPKGYGVCRGHSWKLRPFIKGPRHTYYTRHKRPAIARNIEIYHTLLSFH
jgi:hypothetical protein